MPLGITLFLAALVVLGAWQIDRRGAWGRARPGVLTAVGVVAALVITVIALVATRNFAEREQQRETVERLRAGAVAEYFDVRLGWSADEVGYRLGPPREREAPEAGLERWTYAPPNARRRTIVEFRDGRARGVECSGEYAFDCPPLAGVRIGDAEPRVLERLGEPARVEHGEFARVLVYGTPDRAARIVLRAGRVTTVGVADLSPSPPP